MKNIIYEAHHLVEESFFRKRVESPVWGRLYSVQSAEPCGARGHCHTQLCFVEHPVPVSRVDRVIAHLVQVRGGAIENLTIDDGGQWLTDVDIKLGSGRTSSEYRKTLSNDVQWHLR